MSSQRITQVFVYGTLKRGECREHAWPVSPKSVHPAWIRAALFGRHDYPAIVAGGNRVVGELWSFDFDEMPQVLEVLDEIEGTTTNSSDDLYHRQTVAVFQSNPHAISADSDEPADAMAYSYFYNQDLTADGFKLQPVDGGVQQWQAAR
ncbi:gamma-glutamylcyclotransferase [Rhodopirellula sp. MGV]|uniref:gamma-glutamylcyclotransferase family protein n=1 Tax=Rhodopirellula sp. MGV TaxID=2023130 RepID=UPI000B9704EE|nr:gamma-glutamylcyclotransferase family protein [Rhodopirellula sp. MGV]OYP36583.1 hypothetical protein CGZ80_08110 [Rhodopirellula sp. MGV]PNY34560.1 gamma-glutamylcyclotransferase [Rhodopirellula baltica]